MEGNQMIAKRGKGVIGSQQELAKVLGEDIDNEIFSTVIKGYYILLNQNLIDETWNENEISSSLCRQISRLWYRSKHSHNIDFQHQYPVRSTECNSHSNPSIDFVFVEGFMRASYYSFECKLLKIDDSWRFPYYIDHGVSRYLECKYSKDSKAGVIIGYITKGDINTVISKIIQRVNSENSIELLMDRSNPIDNFQEHYESLHNRNCGYSPFNIHHFFSVV